MPEGGHFIPPRWELDLLAKMQGTTPYGLVQAHIIEATAWEWQLEQCPRWRWRKKKKLAVEAAQARRTADHLKNLLTGN